MIRRLKKRALEPQNLGSGDISEVAYIEKPSPSNYLPPSRPASAPRPAPISVGAGVGALRPWREQSVRPATTGTLPSPPARLDWRPLLFLRKIIGPVGFEPTTSCTRNQRTTKLCYGPYELKIVAAFSAARKLELPPGCCAPHTRPCALRNPFRGDGLGCLRTRAMNPRPLVPETSAPPSLPRFLSGLCLPRPASGLRPE